MGKIKKVYFLSTCDTCKKIMKQVGVTSDFEMVDLKSHSFSSTELDLFLSVLPNPYDLINKRSILYRELNLKGKELSRNEVVSLIKQHYTLIKRPIFVLDNEVFIGNSSSVVTHVKDKIGAV